jgi:hypothetical protein
MRTAPFRNVFVFFSQGSARFWTFALKSSPQSLTLAALAEKTERTTVAAARSRRGLKDIMLFSLVLKRGLSNGDSILREAHACLVTLWQGRITLWCPT